MALRSVADGVWAVDFEFKLLGVQVGLRTTVLGTDDGGVVVLAPAKLEPADLDAIRALGPVRAVIAPNAFHHLFLRRAAEAFPDARVLAAAGVAEKQPELRIHATLGTPEAATLGGFGEAIEAVTLDGARKASETVFFHRPSRTLVATDSVFHIVKSEDLWTRTFLRMNAAYGAPAASRIFRSSIDDRKRFRASIDRALEWDTERIHMAHGELIETGGRDVLARTYAWLK